MEKVKKKKKAYKNNESFKLQIIEEDSKKLNVSLGITAERMDEICNIARGNYHDEMNLSKALEKTVDEMKHINEVVYATLIIGRMHDAGDILTTLAKITGSL